MLTGENGILKRAEGTEIVQAQAELTEVIQLALMESLIDIDNAHTIDNILKIAVANSYISLDGNDAKHMLIDDNPTGTLAEITEDYKVLVKIASTSSYATTGNTYVTDDCEEVTVVDKDLGVWVTIGGTGTNIQITSGTSTSTKDVANMRDITLDFALSPEDGVGNESVQITVTAELEPAPSKTSSKVDSITTPEGAELISTTEVPGSNGDTNLVAVYKVTKNGEYKFKATETNGGTVTGSQTISNAQYAKIQMVSDVAEDDWGTEVNVTITYDPTYDSATTTLQYSTDGKATWQTATQVQVLNVKTNNTTIYARYNVNGSEQELTDLIIENIDDIEPTGTEFEVENIMAGTFDIKITKEATEEESGVAKYEAIVILGETEKVVELKETEGEIKATVEGLSQTTTYKVKVRTTDRVDNYGETGEQEVTTVEEGISLDYVIAQGQSMYTEETDMYSESGVYVMTVPAGFIIRDNTDEDFYERNKLSQGIVIEDSEGNEFVWVPAEDDNESAQKLFAVTSSTTYIGDKYYTGTITDSYYGGEEPRESGDGVELQTLRDNFELMQASVEAKGGFFVGRYETNTSNGSKAGGIVQVSLIWENHYAENQKYTNANNSKISSMMISNSQWDIMLDWMTDEEINRSIPKVDGVSAVPASGSQETDKLRNIYDLIAGAHEFTTGSYSSTIRCGRGGYYLSLANAKHANSAGATGIYNYIGSRLVLIW